MIDGEDGDVDTEESITPSDEEEKEKDKDKKEGVATKDTVEKSKSKQKKVVMTHDAKLKVLKNTFKDWLEYCDISDAPSENLQVQTEGSTYTPAYAANPETLTRWEESRCELDYSNVNEMITVADCLYSPSVEDPEK